MSHLWATLFPAQKVTIVSRGDALGYTFNIPAEDRYLHTREEFQDLMKVLLAGRAAEQVVFGRITNGAANDLERVTAIARVDGVRVRHVRGRPVTNDASGQLRALGGDEAAPRQRAGAAHRRRRTTRRKRLLHKHRPSLDRSPQALLEKETLDRDELDKTALRARAGVPLE